MTGPSTASDVRVCFVGDSLVQGLGDVDALGWVGRVSSAALRAGVALTAYNLGVRRETMTEITARLARECPARWASARDARLVISGGVNDTLSEAGRVRSAHEASCAALKTALAWAKPYPTLVVGPPPVHDAAHSARIGALSADFAGICHEFRVPFIALMPVLAGIDDYQRDLALGDGAHPGSAGYACIAAVVMASPDWWFPPH